ncbi:hypothetical protein KIL84_022677 [Mauremys mutica]|uniref:Uncharacterized protein n=1 Tax=Mauremys mutica TaxID=74926 RepID=A0A9D4AP01_9SAUR|nr:hypothetical protein KIL84_022677 [Mauremys mutica]
MRGTLWKPHESPSSIPEERDLKGAWKVGGGGIPGHKGAHGSQVPLLVCLCDITNSFRYASDCALGCSATDDPTQADRGESGKESTKKTDILVEVLWVMVLQSYFWLL